jgi:hypothetical protein
MSTLPFLVPALVGSWLSAPRAACLLERAAQQELDLGIDAAQLVVGPALERRMERRVQPERECLALRHSS